MTDEDRRHLASALRALRLDAGLSTTQLGERLGMSQSWASKTERGRSLPQPEHVDAWARVCDADPDQRAELVALAERLNTDLASWRASTAPGRVKKQEEIARMEAAASVIRVWQPDVIPGLLQQPGYAEWVFRLGWKRGPDEPLAAVVRSRVARQRVLNDPSKRFEFVMGQAALERVRRELYDEQYARLERDARRPNVYVGVVEFDADETVHQYHGYAIIGEPRVDDDVAVTYETLTFTARLRKAWEVADYLAHFAAVKAASRSWFDGTLTHAQS